MTAAHASLSPSSAHRWLACPASVQLIAETYPDGTPGSEWATEGTQAHTVAELFASQSFGLVSTEVAERGLDRVRREVSPESWGEMIESARGYATLLDSIIDGRPAHVLLEQRFQTGIDKCWGTSDAVIVTEGVIHVVDFKYGRGVPVSAEGNPQLRLYALGAARTMSDLYDFTEVSYTVHQPRLESVSTETTSVAELEKWATEVVEPTARLALEGTDRFGPSEEACRFCPMSGQCRAQRDAAIAADFGDPAVLSPAEIAGALEQVDQIEQWCKSLRETALRLAYEDGVEIPGWKVVRSGGRRTIADPERATEKLTEAGYPVDKISRTTLHTLGVLDKLVGGRKILGEILGDLVQVSEGRESIVPEDDKRSAVNRTADAVRDFGQSES